jgi:preprotein translocase subunit SecG
MSGNSKSSKNTKSSNNTNSFTSLVFDGTAGYGKLMAVITFIFVLLLFLVAIYLVNRFLYKKEDVYDKNFTKGTVKDSTCTKYTNSDNNMKWDCSMNLLYNINNNDYVKNYHISSSTYYTPDTKIDLRYNKYDNKDITTDTYSNTFKGNIIIFIVSIILLASIIQLYSVFKWKVVAAATGAGSLAGSFASKVSGGVNNGNSVNYTNNGIVSGIIENTLRSNRII